MRVWGYRILNVLGHILHLGIVGFIVVGWIPRTLRPWHLGLIALTLAAWIVFGACPLTEAQWAVRRRLGLGKDSSGPYIPFLIRKLTRRPVDTARIDKAVTFFSAGLALLSLGLNAADLWARLGR